MAYGYFKHLARRTASDKILRNKTFNIAKNPKYDGYQRGLASLIYTFFDKKPVVAVLKMKNWLKSYINQLLKNVKKEKYIHHSENIFRVLV